ncbi:ASPIC/UnbV domain-containing protein [Archangium gephyra]|uniref:ASPIC/UnbV domain-containing protein n=1 Tax=Archangium gephyra TaxID=48 RepID=UPI0035D4026D
MGPHGWGGRSQSFSGWEPKKLWLQRPDGSFQESAWSDGFDSRADGRALVALDLDGDGDQDLLMLNRAAPRLQLFVNEGPSGRAMELRLRATGSHREASNATVRVRTSAGTRAFPVLLTRGYLSSVEPVVHVGLGTEEAAEVEVTWREGLTESFGALRSGQRWTLVEGGAKSAEPFRASVPRAAAPKLPLRVEQVGGAVNGHPTAVQVFASWCKPCREEVPVLTALAKQGTWNVRGLGAHTAEQVEAEAGKLGIRYPVAALPEEVAEPLSPRGELTLPTVLLYDASGRLARVVRGGEHLPAALAEVHPAAP